MKTHSFRLRKCDSELEEVLEKMEGKEKAEFIRTALKFYILYGEKLENIEEKIKEMSDLLKNGSVKNTSSLTGENEVNKQDNGILLESIHSLLEL